MKYRWSVFWGGITLAIFLTTSQSQAGESGKVEASDWAVAAPAAYPNVDGVVILDHGFSLWKTKRLQFSRQLRIKVLTERGAELAGSLSVARADYDKLKNLKGRIYKPDGSVIELNKKDIASQKLGDVVVETAQLTGAGVGDIVEWSYEVEYYGGIDKLGPVRLYNLSIKTMGLRQGASERMQEVQESRLDENLEQYVRNLPTWYFDGTFYTLESEYRVELRTRVNYSFWPSNMSQTEGTPEFRQKAIEGVKYYTWNLKDLPPVDQGASTAVDGIKRKAVYFTILNANFGCSIEYTPFDDSYWGPFGVGLRTFMKQYCDNNGGCRRKAEKLVASLESDRDKVDAIYNYVTSEYKPEKPLLVMRPLQWNVGAVYDKKPGAGFEINTLLLEMLRGAGIEADPVFVSTKGRASFHYIGRFNHMLVMATVEGKQIFLDACVDGCSPGTLPYFSDVDEGFLVKDDQLAFCPVIAEPCTTELPVVVTDVP